MKPTRPRQEELAFSTRLSLGLFVIGTLLLIVFAAGLSPTVAIIGYAYTVLALVVGSVYVIVLIRRLVMRRLILATGLKAMGIILLNIPVAIFYFYLVLILMNTARITFENTTGRDISSVRITGCENREIESLRNGESKTIWLNIAGDCSVEIEYEHDGELKKEVVAGYLTNLNRVIATYHIGSGKEILF